MDKRFIFPKLSWITRSLVMIWWILCALSVTLFIRQAYEAMPWSPETLFGLSFNDLKKPTIVSFYLVGLFSILLVLGSMFWVMITRLINAKWGKNISFIWESVAWASMGGWLIGLAAMYCGSAVIYQWFEYYIIKSRPVSPIFSQDSAFWWNADAFYLRQACFFVAIGIMVNVWRHRSVESWANNGAFRPIKQVWIALLTLFLVAVTSLGTIDWIGGLQADDVPSLLPFYGILFALVLSLSVGICGLIQPLKQNSFIVIPWRKIGGVLLTMVLIKSYLLYGQYIITWFSNLPETTEFYADRMIGQWGWVALSSAIFEMVLPILLLLIPSIRFSQLGNLTAAILIIIGSILELWWLIGPIVGLSASDLSSWVCLSIGIFLLILVILPAYCYQLNQASLFTNARKK